MMIKRLPIIGETKCPWHGDETFGTACPVLWHTLYPYFLGALFGAKYGYNEEGDCQVCCPAEFGVDVLVKKREKLIYAKVVKVNGHCDYDYQVGHMIAFPMQAKNLYACPAGIFNLFPFLDITMPSCINLRKLRCPDWKENIYYDIGDEKGICRRCGETCDYC